MRIKIKRNKISRCDVELHNVLFATVKVAGTVGQKTLMTGTNHTAYTGGSQALGPFLIGI